MTLVSPTVAKVLNIDASNSTQNPTSTNSSRALLTMYKWLSGAELLSLPPWGFQVFTLNKEGRLVWCF